MSDPSAAPGLLGLLPSTLKSLSLKTDANLRDVGQILTKLETLSFDGRQVRAPSALPSSLKTLRIYDPPSCLPMAPVLGTLELFAIQPRSLIFRLGGCDTPEPAPSDRSFPSVSRLSLSDSRLEHDRLASILSRFPNLQVLSLAQSRLDRMPDLTGFTQLTEVNLEGMNAVDLAGLLPRSLETLLLASSEIDALPELPALKVLDIANTPVSSLAPLQGAPELRELTLHEGQLTELGEGFPKLQELRILPSSAPR